MEQFWNYWDFRVESSEDVYFNAHLESVKIVTGVLKDQAGS